MMTIRQIYEKSFPHCERREWDAHLACCKNPAFHPDVLRRDGNDIGLMFYWDYLDSAYLEHFALAPEYRNCGIGGRFLDEWIEKHPRLILEADPPVTDIARRRISFYQRHGLSLTGIQFTHPGYGQNPEPYTLCLMTRPMWTNQECARFLEFLFEVVLKKPRRMQ